VHRAERVALADQSLAAEQFDQHDAGGEHVHRGRRQAALGGLGRHVAGGADDLIQIARVVQPRGDAEVHHAGTAGRVDEDVRRLQIPVHDARSVGRLERVQHAQ
jgi:hypothetical protein